LVEYISADRMSFGPAHMEWIDGLVVGLAIDIYVCRMWGSRRHT